LTLRTKTDESAEFVLPQNTSLNSFTQGEPKNSAVIETL